MKPQLPYQTTVYTLLSIAVILLMAFTPDKKPKNITEPEVVNCQLQGSGKNLSLSVYSGQSHNHPTFAIWVEDNKGHMIQPLFVTRAIATGLFPRAEVAPLVWDTLPGKIDRPSALPYYSHKLKAYHNQHHQSDYLIDGCSGATPKADFTLNTQLASTQTDTFNILVEVNQTWDWNKYWNNTLYPDDLNYKYSCQPALVYHARVITTDTTTVYTLTPIGHSHYSGQNGNLYPDLSTITTAKQIFDIIQLTVK